jgi:hypothetical protein
LPQLFRIRWRQHDYPLARRRLDRDVMLSVLAARHDEGATLGHALRGKAGGPDIGIKPVRCAANALLLDDRPEITECLCSGGI